MFLEWQKGYVQFLQDWAEWFTGQYNWRNFHFIAIQYEDEWCMGNRECVLYFLGVGLRICWVYNEHAEDRIEVKRRMEEIKARYGDKP